MELLDVSISKRNTPYKLNMLKNGSINYLLFLVLLLINLFFNEKIIANTVDSLDWWRDSTMHLSKTDQRAYLEKALITSRQEKLNEEEGLTLLKLSDWELKQANYSEAFKVMDTLNDLLVNYPSTTLSGMELIQRGRIHIGLKQYEPAKRLLKTCVDKSLSDPDLVMNLGNAYNTLGTIEYFQKNPTTALAYYEKAIPIFEKLGKLKLLNATWGNMALIYLQQNQPEKALAYFLKQLTFFQQLNAPLELAQINGNIGYTYFLLNEVPKAIPFYEKSIAIAKEQGFKEVLAVTHQDLAATYKSIGDTKNALKNFEAYHQLETQNISERALKEVNALQIKYDKEVQDKKIVQQEQELATLRQGKTIRQLLVALLICLLSIGLLYYYTQKSKIKQIQIAKQLNEEKLKNEIALENKEKSLLQAQLLSKEKDITSLALNISRKNDFATAFERKLIALEKELPDNFQVKVKELSIFTNAQFKVDEELELFQQNIEAINHDFYQKLDKIAKFSQSEKHICGLMRLNLSNKEIALLRNTTVGSTKVFRYRIRKKLGLQPNEDIFAFLQNI